MLRRHLYLRITALVIGSLFAFNFLAMGVWGLLGLDSYEDELYYNSGGLAEYLAPPPNAAPADYSESVSAIAQVIDGKITIYAEDQSMVFATHAPEPLVEIPEEANRWKHNFLKTRWYLKLDDGRYIVLALNRAPSPDEPVSFSLFLLILSLLVGLLMYPFIRNVTRRLERLQASVEHIGAGALTARVKVEGDDEVAAVARSFNDAAEKIERLVESQRLLLAHASHELRTPLARIRFGIEFLKEQLVASSQSSHLGELHDADEVLSEIESNPRLQGLETDIVELDALIEELLLLSRLEAASVVASREPVDLLALTAIECANYADCTLSGEEMSPVEADGRMIQHLLRNLLDNAERHGATPITVDLRQDAEWTVISVSDAGKGIPEALQEGLFEPFRRGADKQNVPGHGLGLALVKRIVDSHNGEIEIVNTPVSKFTIRLPR